ncbi:hypothetical protein KIW84_010587 [Lathyrus oleraceus]|uniref:Uncharacterized protein n=1 Tax=Pisum sativum TaxID=3888 RepID=A0A9D4YPQ1_PEA|nr:hypothetical protein KIW84_010587 [Pisum sativum]
MSALSIFILILFCVLSFYGAAYKITSLPDQPPVNFSQHSDYITVDVNYQRNLFYYFVEAEVDPSSKPVILWLHGGPGCSAIGETAFTQHEPFLVSPKGLVKNPFSWNRGPGCSAIGEAAFTQHRPFLVSPKGLVKNPLSWNKEANMIYLDSPAGVGFSYSANVRCPKVLI